MAGSTTVTGNKGRTRKTSSRTKIRYSWRKRRAFAIIQHMRDQMKIDELVKVDGL